MDQKRILLLVGMLFGLLCVSLIGCQMFNQDGQTPTTPATGSLDIANCAQMEDGSTVVDGHQLNWVVSDWGSMPYGYWMYVELNEQDAAGKRPGENQIPVTLGNVVLSFSGLPGAVSHIVIGVKAVQDPQDDTFTECGRAAVVNGSVSIPVDYGDLVHYFGSTHYSIWFQALGGENGQGIACGQIAVSGVMSSGQTVTLSKRICFGTNPVVPPMPTPVSPTPTPAPPALGGVLARLVSARQQQISRHQTRSRRHIPGYLSILIQRSAAAAPIMLWLSRYMLA